MDTAARDLHVQVRRTYAAAPAAVYAAWTDPEALGSWFCPAPDLTVVVHGLELRVGGRYRIEMRPRTGASWIVAGTYTALDAPRHLAFTWAWEHAPVEEATLVTVDLIAAGEGTELVLTHARFATEASRDGHTEGWNASLSRLAAVLHVS